MSSSGLTSRKSPASVTPTVYELKITDWDKGLWQEEIDWIRDLFEGTTESVTMWQFIGGEYSRYNVGPGT